MHGHLSTYMYTGILLSYGKKKNQVFLFLPVIGGSPHVEHRRVWKQTENILFLLWI